MILFAIDSSRLSRVKYFFFVSKNVCWKRNIWSTIFFAYFTRNDSLYEEFRAAEMGTTFVELIKRPGTYLGLFTFDQEKKF